MKMPAHQLACVIAHEIERQAEENPSQADCDPVHRGDMNRFAIDGRFDLEAVAAACIKALSEGRAE